MPPIDKRCQMLTEHVCKYARELLDIEPGQPINLQQPLQELNLNSLMAVKLKESLELSVGQTLPITLLFDYPTVEAVVNYLAQEVFLWEVPEKYTQNCSPGSDPTACIGNGKNFQ